MIRLRTLGQLDLDGPGEQALRGALAQPRRAALLVYLALATPRGHHRRDALLALFWPESDVERARNALNQAVHFLRLALAWLVLALTAISAAVRLSTAMATTRWVCTGTPSGATPSRSSKPSPLVGPPKR